MPVEVLRKTYTIQVIMKESSNWAISPKTGADEFWANLANRSGCDDVVEKIKTCLALSGFKEPDCEVFLVRYEHT